MYYLQAGYGKHDRLRNALLAALAFHAALILGVSFDVTEGDYQAPQIEVTLATRASEQAPDDARLMAQANQVGSGDQAELNALTTRDKQFPADAEAMRQAPPVARDDTSTSRRLLATRTEREREVAASEPAPDARSAQFKGLSPEVDRISQQLANLEAELDQQTRNYVTQPRVRRLTAASARQAVDAAYLLDWRQRLEAVGNRYYPEASVRYGIYGDLRLLVAIRQDGSLEDIQVLSSSGYAVLDEAAIKIVRMAAPFAPFPPELRATTDRLEIIRTWQFQENQLSSNR
jgi:protein TonB